MESKDRPYYTPLTSRSDSTIMKHRKTGVVDFNMHSCIRYPIAKPTSVFAMKIRMYVYLNCPYDHKCVRPFKLNETYPFANFLNRKDYLQEKWEIVSEYLH